MTSLAQWFCKMTSSSAAPVPLCFPTCDASQLLAITKFLVVIVHWVDRPRSLYADEEAFDP